MNTRKRTILIGLAILWAFNLFAQSIDTTFVRIIDIDYDGIKDSIILNIKGQSMERPFSWSFSVKSNQKLIYSCQRDDAWLDKFFSDTNYVGNCKDYLNCKKAYYFDYLPTKIINKSIKIDSKAIHYCPNCKTKYSIDKIKAISNELTNRIKENGFIYYLEIPQSAVQDDFPIAFSDNAGSFVTIGQW
jgi:hypothetical protein